ncbi:adenylyltransferase/cytidyltransferase family protein [Candidatus Woesearchaeota archaeon]|nr:adenylyltransferase/cytidyltransferase family protein [Candidatus Woesearchaeota archaeon]
MLEIKDTAEYRSDKVLTFKQAIGIIHKIKSQGKKVGLCHGGFDLLHPGHIKHFESAKKLCDILVVSITSDRFIKKRKGLGRPIFHQQLRAYSIACIRFVDFVVISDFNLGINTIKSLKPSYYIKGPDYIDKDHREIHAEKETVKSVGGEIKYTNDPKLSTTKIIHYIREIL